MSLEDKIAAYLKQAHPSAPGGVKEILLSEDLFRDGWMDSLLQLRLLTYLEEEFLLRIPPFQVTRKSFLSVASIASLLARKS